MWVTCLDIYGSFFGGKSKSEFPNPKTDFAFLGGKSKNGSWIHKINTLGGFFGSNPIRIFEIYNLSVFWKRICMKNSIFDNRFSEQKWYTTDAVHARHSNRTQLQSFHVCFFFLVFAARIRVLFFCRTRSTRTCRCHGKWSLIFGFSIFLVVKNPYDLRPQTVFGFSIKNASINYPV